MKTGFLLAIGCLLASGCLGGLFHSHYQYLRRAEAARMLSDGTVPKPGRIYYASFPENRLVISILGWYPNVGHAALVTSDRAGVVKQYDYGWFTDDGGGRPENAIGYTGDSPSYGVVKRKTFPAGASAKATNDMEVAKMVLEAMPGYGGKVELWARDVGDIGIAERYMEQLAGDRERGSMAWRCWQVGGYRCGNVARQAFDAARGEGHFLDLLWGGFPGADAPSIGTGKTVYSRKCERGEVNHFLMERPAKENP